MLLIPWLFSTKACAIAGERHEDALALLQALPIDNEELNKKTRQLSRLLAVKTAAEYNEKLMTKKDASSALMDSGRILEWVNKHLDLR